MGKAGLLGKLVLLGGVVFILTGCSTLQSTALGSQNEARSNPLGSQLYPFEPIFHTIVYQFPLASVPSTYNQETIYWVQINSQEGLSALNKEAFSTAEYLDFSTYSLILVTQTKGTSGYELKVTSVQDESIVCKETRPSDNATLPNVMTYPTEVILINKALAIKRACING